jgi:hypothetical protein
MTSLISNDKPPLGFLDPWLHGNRHEGLYNIISGSDPSCNTNAFSAIAGWDPVLPASLVILYRSRVPNLENNQDPEP